MLQKLIAIFVVCVSSQALSQSVTVTNLYSFPKTYEEEVSTSQIIQAQDNNFYGITSTTDFYFEVSPSGGTEQALMSDTFFLGVTNLVQGADANFYGAVTYGDGGSYFCGGNPCGVLFKITPQGVATTLHVFTGGADGGYPSGLILGTDGNLYGTASYGGNLKCTVHQDGLSGCGTVFRVTPAGAFSVLYTFQGGSDAAFPTGGLLQAVDGNFYGETESTLYQLTPAGKLTTLGAVSGCGEGGCGDVPVEGSDGSLYGVSDTNTIYKFDGKVSTLYTLPNGTGYTDYIEAPLFAASDGYLYGVTHTSIFRISTSGEFETLFTPDPSSYDYYRGLVQGGDGGLYGVSSLGYGYGWNVFELSLSPSPLPPVQFSLNANTVLPGTVVKANLTVRNAFSATMQQCYGFITAGSAVVPVGQIKGAYNSTTKLYAASLSFPATQLGAYRLAVTCGGVESASANLNVAYPTTTTLAATPNPVTPPGTVVFTAVVQRSGNSGTPTGTVTFYDGSIAVNTSSLDGKGVAIYKVTSNGLPAASYPITATYSGDTGDTASSSNVVSVVVN